MKKAVATTHRRKGGVVIRQVTESSLAASCGLEAGDTIYAINEQVIPDSLSYQFNIAFPQLNMVIQKSNGETWELELENDFSEPFGVDLEEDPIMLCRNKCIFCFVDQNPKGYRKSLLIKDEDIRLSFMYGNYTTLSSTDEAEEDRIIRERISPLYVSVHATDPETRIFMLKSKKQGYIMPRLRKFAAGGIDIHAQIVLCPGINDGSILKQTLSELSELYPRLKSIAIVPLGITKHRLGLVHLTPITDAYCASFLDEIEAVRVTFQKKLGDPLVYLGDEFYLRAGREIPPAKAYRDFPQFENGIGMIRRFTDTFEKRLPKTRLKPQTHGTVTTGTLFGPVLTQLVAKMNEDHGTRVRVRAIVNDSFGSDLITVAGLVHGRDMMDQLADEELGDFIAIPQVMLRDGDDQIMVDDYAPHHLAQKFHRPVVVTPNEADGFLRVLSNWQAHVVATPPSAKTQASAS
ncbi:MAG: DUF512 domain-containing protein [Acidobacteria bacterium]|nr:DUF512 domain-containing protein [Acidobacteriota bacterium]